MLTTIDDFFKISRFIPLSVALGIAIALPTQAQTPANSQQTGQAATSESSDTQKDERPLALSDSVFSLAGGKQLMAEATKAIGAEKYDVAIDKLQQARKIFNQLSNFHLQIANSFSGIDTKIFDAQRNIALETGEMRDEATYQLALVHRAQNQPELAVPLLIQVIRSQNPTSNLGRKSYQQLYEIGFVDTPYSASSPTSATPAPAKQ
jgi:thioredoxin-like negative regulator of GroEL